MKKRFIAGAVCPKCAAQDSIQAYELEDEQVMVRECVDCGFIDRMSTVVNQPRELGTRVTPKRPLSSDESIQVINIMSEDKRADDA